MSQSPRDTEDVQHSAPSPDDDAPQQTEGDAADMNRPDLDLGYDFEVKEQDRWLPIANGAYSNISPLSSQTSHTSYPPEACFSRVLCLATLACDPIVPCVPCPQNNWLLPGPSLSIGTSCVPNLPFDTCNGQLL
jgi:hypothetical protein